MDADNDSTRMLVGRDRRAPAAASTWEVSRDIDACAAEWDLLADRTHALPYVRPGWVEAWWRAFGRGRLEVVLVRRAGRLVGLVPLVRTHRGVRSPTNWHTPAFALLHEDEAAAQELARAVFARRPASAQLAFIDPDGSDRTALRRAAEAARYSVLERAYVQSPYLQLDGDWASYERGLSKNVRGDISRRRRRLAEAGASAVQVADGTEDLDGLLEEGFRVEASGWKASQGTAIRSEAATRAFYTEIARWAAARGCLRLGFLRLDGQVIAFVYDIEEAGVHYYLKGGYDPAFSQFSPAKVLLHAMVERAFAEGLERFEFLGGDEPYKRHWANATRELRLLQFFAPTPLGLLQRNAYSSVRPFAKRILASLGR
jgi:CelD/BcsL family acetyltransferase involved in cellulose biosynthesis